MSTALVSITSDTQELHEKVSSWIGFLDMISAFDPNAPEVQIIDEINDPDEGVFAFLVYMPEWLAVENADNADNGTYGVTFEVLDNYIPYYDDDYSD